MYICCSLQQICDDILLYKEVLEVYEDEWRTFSGFCLQLRNICIPVDHNKLLRSDVEFALTFLSSIEYTVKIREPKAVGPFMMMLGMAFVPCANVKLQYILNALLIVPSYDTINQFQQKMPK